MLILTYLAQVCVVDELLHDLHLAADHKLYLLSQKTSTGQTDPRRNLRIIDRYYYFICVPVFSVIKLLLKLRIQRNTKGAEPNHTFLVSSRTYLPDCRATHPQLYLESSAIYPAIHPTIYPWLRTPWPVQLCKCILFIIHKRNSWAT